MSDQLIILFPVLVFHFTYCEKIKYLAFLLAKFGRASSSDCHFIACSVNAIARSSILSWQSFPSRALGTEGNVHDKSPLPPACLGSNINYAMS